MTDAPGSADRPGSPRIGHEASAGAAPQAVGQAAASAGAQTASQGSFRSAQVKSNESLPDCERKRFDSKELTELVDRLARHYKMSACFLALESPEGVHLKGCYGLTQRFLRHSQDTPSICQHNIARDLPVIIDDAAADPRFQNDELVQHDPHIRFFAGAPLIFPGNKCVGTLCLADSQPPKQRFTLRDCEVLTQAAKEVVRIYQANASEPNQLWVLSIDSLVSIAETQGSERPIEEICKDEEEAELAQPGPSLSQASEEHAGEGT